MAEISFYHLSKSSLERAIAKLLEKILASGKRAVILTDTFEKATLLNSGLWTYSQAAFIPHGTKDDGFAEHQPVYITDTLENPNKADFLLITDGIEISDFLDFERCFDVFNGLDITSVEEARKRWKTYSQSQHQLVYWFQNEEGQWQQKQ